MSKQPKGSKQLQGIGGNGSGENEVIVMQKNGVIRIRRLKKGKNGGVK